ncbi:hypothetical protein RKK10_25305 [Klebsiella pneumoniae]|uniref:glycosyltransferase family 2 protein n=1 Tax=Klebsiella pneumoniae TaxID=573 RepID=UPI001CDA2DC2|nr:hypothetical protein [Klebsiella pneumoniae]MDY1654010.1 hypothetical protein [Klebsiella pneumoniae]
MGEISVKTGNNARNGGKNSLNRLIRCVCGKKIGPDPRNFNQRVSLGRNDLLIRTFPGCFMLLTNVLLQKLNGFDERYFMYLEDVDLCRRALQLTKIYYCPETTIVHVFNKGSYKSKLLLWYHIRSAITYFNKWGWFFDKKRYAYNESALRNIPRKLS